MEHYENGRSWVQVSYVWLLFSSGFCCWDLSVFRCFLACKVSHMEVWWGMSIDIWITYESIVHTNTCSFFFKHILGFPKDLTVKNLTPTTASMIITDWRWCADVHRKVGNGRCSIIDTSLTYYHVVIWIHHSTLHHVCYVAISFMHWPYHCILHLCYDSKVFFQINYPPRN